MSLETAQKRRSEQRAEARRAILDATESILVESGQEGFSIRRLAERCGYTAPTIYHYFRDKTGLLHELLDERFGELLAELHRVEDPEDPAETIRARALAFVHFGLRNPNHYRLLSGTASPPSLEAAREFLDRPWRKLAERGRLPGGDIEAAQRSMHALLHGLISLLTTRPDLDWPPTAAQDAIGALLAGLMGTLSDGGAAGPGGVR